jgi:hypothetical protein
MSAQRQLVYSDIYCCGRLLNISHFGDDWPMIYAFGIFG